MTLGEKVKREKGEKESHQVKLWFSLFPSSPFRLFPLLYKIYRLKSSSSMSAARRSRT